MHKTILLTGATGFLGSHLLKALVTEGYHVIVLKRSTSDIWRIKNIYKNVKFYDIDVVEIEKAFGENIIHAVIHTATHYGRSLNDTQRTLESNLIFPVKLLEIAIKNNVELFINTDSYFNKDDKSYSSLINYSLSKKAFLTWLKIASKKIKVSNMILEHLYGPWDDESKFVESMIRKILMKDVSSIELTPGDQVRDFIYVDDVVSAYLKALSYGLTNSFRIREYEVGTGRTTSVKDFVLKIKKITNSDIDLKFGVLPYRHDEIMDSFADTVELNNIGWQPQYTIEDGLLKIINEY